MFVSKLLSLKLQCCEKYIKRCRQQVGCRKEHWIICITSITPGCLPLSWGTSVSHKDKLCSPKLWFFFESWAAWYHTEHLSSTLRNLDKGWIVTYPEVVTHQPESRERERKTLLGHFRKAGWICWDLTPFWLNHYTWGHIAPSKGKREAQHMLLETHL